MALYNVYRIFRDRPGKRLIYNNMTLEEAQAHCRDPETSSSTCTSSVGLARTRKYGPWFECYMEN
jgi:hypothetical protein